MKVLFTIILCLVNVGVYAADAPENKMEANKETIESLAATCSACHGAYGISVNPAWPNLAGQKRGYLATQIKLFRDGVRDEPVMYPFVKELTNEQIDLLAAHYASMSLSDTPPSEKTIASVNEAGKNVRAYCISCHGKQGITANEQWPNLAGQQKDYLQKQLLDYQSGKRTGLPMSVIANELTVEQIEAVAEYYSQLPHIPK